jgi:hypothetical protein
MLAHRHARSALLALFALTCASAASADDANDPLSRPTYRSTVSEVRVTFFATDEKGRPVENLTKSDLAVVDNELVVRNFRSFAHSDETSLDVVALVDVSESVAPRFRAALSDVLQLVARQQSIPDDNLAVVSFGGARPAILCSGSCRAPDSMSKLKTVKSSGTTPLFDALIFAADFISHHRRAGSVPSWFCSLTGTTPSACILPARRCRRRWPLAPSSTQWISAPSETDRWAVCSCGEFRRLPEDAISHFTMASPRS